MVRVGVRVGRCGPSTSFPCSLVRTSSPLFSSGGSTLWASALLSLTGGSLLISLGACSVVWWSFSGKFADPLACDVASGRVVSPRISQWFGVGCCEVVSVLSALGVGVFLLFVGRLVWTVFLLLVTTLFDII